MKASDRRKELLNILSKSDEPKKGEYLSDFFGVSRQIIVKDIAILRASGENIVSMKNGYMLSKNNGHEFIIKCRNHKTSEELFEELDIIIDFGATVKDVIVEHPIYGEVKAVMDINSKRKLDKYMKEVSDDEFRQLSLLSSRHHLHTIEVPDRETFMQIKNELREKGILCEDCE